jgi:hypothetical protein
MGCAGAATRQRLPWADDAPTTFTLSALVSSESPAQGAPSTRGHPPLGRAPPHAHEPAVPFPDLDGRRLGKRVAPDRLPPRAA